jgi:calcineurin-like phosphoesterase
VIDRFLKQLPARFEVARGDVRLSAVLIEADESSGRALSIRRIMRPLAFAGQHN